MARFFDPPAPKPTLRRDKIDKTYKSMRLKVFLGSFLGYFAYYLVRKNLSVAAPDMISQGLLTKEGFGIAASAVSIAYAFSKFIMGSVSDRSDCRKFLVSGLVALSLVMIITGVIPYSATNVSLNVILMFIMMLIVGWLSGMGWPPCGRVMSHWFSQNERSFKMSLWNTSHTFGGGTMGILGSAGMAILASWGISQSWRGAFIFPSMVAIVIAIFCWLTLRDTPESCGLPAIEDYRHDYTGVKAEKGEEIKIPFKRLFVDYVFKNKMLWIIAIANAFVYLVRYGVGDWSPTYLQETGIMNGEESRIAFSLHNYAGVVGTIVCGLISTKWFKGRCAPANVLYMVLVLIGVLLYWQAGPVASYFVGIFGGDVAAATRTVVLVALIGIGFFIYGPVALIGIQALNLVPKNAAGTAAGFVGFFGYLLGDAILAKIVMGAIADSNLGWNATFWMFAIACVIATVLCATTWKQEKEDMIKNEIRNAKENEIKTK
ncbi:MAG: MFS transporter [Bacteroidales bacterium]|jgi:OPA family glycerol-3-phosphate transporter-like MFS transporter|nr:MFS transporter [Bacteroidales bacterium]MCI2122255.1 MFS transporter [Bacteroidales bacterium]MCI2145297.1 MFS transporter [Bacteroidales bacterium]